MTRLGLTRLLALDEGIAGDDTGGHIDDFARLAPGHDGGSGELLLAEDDGLDVNFLTLEDSARVARKFCETTGTTLRRLPMPTPRSHHDERVPASYANALIVNGGVIVPTFADWSDAAALEVWGTALPGRTVVPVDCRRLVVGLGAVHCLTMQRPAREAADNS